MFVYDCGPQLAITEDDGIVLSPDTHEMLAGIASHSKVADWYVRVRCTLSSHSNVVGSITASHGVQESVEGAIPVDFLTAISSGTNCSPDETAHPLE